MNDWDPAHYRQFADERSRPYGDLLARIGAERPRRVVDLGCGSGELTASLARLWPTAEIVGVDSSPAMIERARSIKGVDDLRFLERDLRDWRPDARYDVLVSNATLQWVPDHRALLPRSRRTAGPGRLARLPGARELRRAQPRPAARARRHEHRTPSTPRPAAPLRGRTGATTSPT